VKKTEMTAAQLVAREAFVQLLEEAGWDVEGWEHLFENGASLTPEARAEHGADRCDLRLGYWVRDGYAQLDIADRAAGEHLRMRLYPAAGMDAVVGRVITWQDALDAESLPRFVRAAAPACRGLFLETGDEFVALAVDEDAAPR